MITGGRHTMLLAYAEGTCPCSVSVLAPQVERQIEQMVRFIKQEAEEKANEIRVSAEEVGLLGLQVL